MRVLNVEARRYALEFCRRSDRDEEAIAARNEALADVAEMAVRAGKPPTPHFELTPRLIARDAYQNPLPPDPWEDVLRADLRFLVWRFSIDLVDRVVGEMEREQHVPHDLRGSPRPRGNRHKAKSDEARQAWGQYLFERGMEHQLAGWDVEAEAYYRDALRVDPGHANAWVHLGGLCLQEGYLVQAKGYYERGQAAAEVRTIREPKRYSSLYRQALLGRGVSLWRLGRLDDAREDFERVIALNPNDSQGYGYLLHHLDQSLSWEESQARLDEEALADYAETFWRDQEGRRGAGVVH